MLKIALILKESLKKEMKGKERKRTLSKCLVVWSTNWGHCKLKSTVNANQVKCWFLKRGENRSTRRKTSRCRVENQQTQPTHGAGSGNRTRATLVGGECSHHCAILVPKGRSGAGCLMQRDLSHMV